MTGHAIKKETSQAVKGLLSLVILFHHFTTSLDGIPLYFDWLKYIAFPLVGLFFFISGYGLTVGMTEKEDYLKGFIKKRFSKVLLPFAVTAAAATAVFSIVKGHFINAFSISFILPFWFVYVILAVYLAYYLLFRFFSIHKAAGLMLLLTIIYIAVSIPLNPDRNEMYASVIAFPVGILFRLHEDRLFAMFERGYVPKLTALVTAFFIVFSLRLALAYRLTDSNLLHTVLRNIVTVLFVMTFGVFAQRISIKNKLLALLGAISYEIYIIHPVLIKLYVRLFPHSDTAERMLMVAVVVIATLLLAILLHFLLSKLNIYGGIRNVKKT